MPTLCRPTTTELRRRTTLGYRMVRCRACWRTHNERTGTPFNHLQVPTDVAVLGVLWRLQYKLTFATSPRWSSRAASRSPMRRYGRGRSASLPCSLPG